jgi:exodeoxyribonuclease VII large subunit
MIDSLMTPPPEQVLKVTALTRLIKGQLESEFSRIWVQGEISNLRRQSSGHLYFSLKDAGSQLPCALFARDAARQSFEIEDGMEVLLMGDISVFEPHGRYQLIAKIAIQSGEGRLQVEFERLKRKLASEGLFDAERKQSLPLLPRRIAVITSPTGAAVQDFLRILRRRDYRGEVVIFPARVQGKGAAEEIASMLQHAGASAGFDLAVITRGGGSIEDLWAFNMESLARAVAACPLPVISAVGHEIDTVLTDYAADRRAETPSGAAELISSLYLDALARVERAGIDLRDRIERTLTRQQTNLRELSARIRFVAPDRKVAHRGMQLDELENRLSRTLSKRIATGQQTLNGLAQKLTRQHPSHRIGMAKQQLSDFDRRLKRALAASQEIKTTQMKGLEKRLSNGSLQATLRRGFTVIQNEKGSVVDNATAAREEALLSARFHDGEVKLKPQR